MEVDGQIVFFNEAEEVWLLPVTNSPRMGVCGYEGSSVYPEQFEPDEIC